jgi:hypothetical protein
MQSQGNDFEREMIVVVVEEYLVSHRERNHQLLGLKARVRSSLKMQSLQIEPQNTGHTLTSRLSKQRQDSLTSCLSWKYCLHTVP